jgi:DNA-binding NarL/FixJ family response regulator
MAGRGNIRISSGALHRWSGDWAQLHDVLRQWHAEAGTRTGDRVAWRQAQVARMIGDGLSQDQAAARLGCSTRTVRRDYRTILRVVP